MPIKHQLGGDDLPAAAWTFFLLAGAHANCRLPGWPSALGMTGSPTPDTVWSQHQSALLREAEAAGFQPYWQTKKRPRGPKVRSWCADFVARHRY